jgi:hypothetical protein
MRATTRAVLCMALAAMPVSLVAQGVAFQSVDNVHFYGALGTFVNFAARLGGGSMHDITATTYISGHKLRRETQDDGTIIDVDAGRVTSFDNKKKTYYSTTFDQMAAAMQAGIDQASQERAQQVQQQGSKSKTTTSDAKGEVDFKTSVSFDRTSDHETIAGYDAQRSFLTITIDATAKPKDDKAEQAGSMVFLIDEWKSTDAPQAKQMEDFQRAYAQKLGQAFRAPMQSLQAAFRQDERIKVGFEAAAKEMAKVPGVPLRTVTYVAVVPPGMQFDRKLVLDDGANASKSEDSNPKKQGGGFKGLMGRLKTAAEQANKPDTAKTTQQPKQATLMTMKNEVTSITVGGAPADKFEAPAGYQQIGMPMRQP